MFKTNHLFLAGLAIACLSAQTQAAGAAETLESAMKEVAASLGPSLSESGLKKLAVVEFTDLNGYRSALGPFLAEELTTQLIVAKPGAFDFVERQQLVKVLEEQKLTSSSLFEAGSIASVGKVLGIQAIVTGSMADLGDEIKINTRVISVESARIVAAASTSFPRAGSAEVLLRQTGGTQGRSFGLAAKSTQASDVFFKNDQIQVTVESISLSNDKERLYLVLAIENISTETITLQLNKDKTSITASGGGQYGCGSVDGMTDQNQHSFTSFDARSRSIVSFSFYANRQIAEADYYSFSAIVNRGGNDHSPISIGISGIRLEPSTAAHSTKN